MGGLHARTVRGSRLAELCGVVDRDRRIADVVGADLGVAGIADLVEAVGELSPDAAIVATPGESLDAPEHPMTTVNATNYRPDLAFGAA